MTESVLLLHGPLNKLGIDPVSQHFPLEERLLYNTPFNAEAMTRALAMSFRAQGFKIVYSGWTEDEKWLQANASLFDEVVVSDQTGLGTEFGFLGQTWVNNKTKLYYGVLRGVETVFSAFGSDAIVFRLRSDVAVNPALAVAELQRVAPSSGILLIEYLNMDKMFHVPDFMQIAETVPLMEIYRHLYTLSVSGNSYHLSSHIDHCFAYLRMVELGHLKEIQCMGRPMYDAVAWRGIPRYLEAATASPGYDKDLFFGGRIHLPVGQTVDNVLQAIKSM